MLGVATFADSKLGSDAEKPFRDLTGQTGFLNEISRFSLSLLNISNQKNKYFTADHSFFAEGVLAFWKVLMYIESQEVGKMPAIYSVKLDRAGGIHPGDIPAGKLAELLAVLSKQFAGREDDFCLAALADNCVRLDFKVRSSKVKSAIVAFSTFIAGQAASSDIPGINNLIELDRVRAKFADITMTFSAFENIPAVTLPADRKLSDMIKPKPNIRFRHTIYGKVMDAGGERPNIHIRPLGGGADIICDCSEELAAEVGGLLYSVVGIFGEVTRSSDPIRMKALALLPYRKPNENPFSILKETGVGKYFENESVEEFMHKVRGNGGENHE